MTKTTRSSDQLHLVLVDDHPFAREALRRRLEVVPRFKVVGEAGDFFEALALLDATELDLVVIDIGLGKTADKPNGLFLAREIRRRGLETRVVFWTMYDGADYVAAAKAAGACGYVLKTRSTEEIVKAIEEAVAGRCYYSDGLDQMSALAPELTTTEKKILKGVESGKSSKEIAEELGNDHRTVDTHRRNIKSKLGAKNAAEMIAIALRLGLIDALEDTTCQPCARSGSARRGRSAESNLNRSSHRSDPSDEACEE